jgi:hypothetical protein
MYYISVLFLFLFSVFSPVLAIADSADEVTYTTPVREDARYDFNRVKEYQVDGHSMENYGFMDGMRINVVAASSFVVGDVIAFECGHEKCDGAYVKKITQKDGACYWVEGRKDVWMENGSKRQSMDSRTTFGWLCDDDITIIGAAFTQGA